MAKLIVGETIWATMQEGKLNIPKCFEVVTVPDEKYAAILADMFKVTGSAPKAEDKGKGKKGGKKQKGEEKEDEE